MENIENIITENIEDVVTVIPEEVIPVSTDSGLKVAGWVGLGAIVGCIALEGGKRIYAKIKAKKAEKEVSEDNVVVEIDDFVDAEESK